MPPPPPIRVHNLAAVNVPVSPDGKWWWNGQAWNPVGTYAPPTPTRAPGAVVAAVVINLAGAGLVILLGLLLLIVSRSPEFTKQLQTDVPSGIDPSTFALILTFGILGYGIYLGAVNSLLGWFMLKGHAWAWITTVVLIGIGMLVQLFSAIGSPQALIWVALFQIPSLVLLLLAPSRRWCHISRDQPRLADQYPQPYAGYAQPMPPAPPPPPSGPPRY